MLPLFPPLAFLPVPRSHLVSPCFFLVLSPVSLSSCPSPGPLLMLMMPCRAVCGIADDMYPTVDKVVEHSRREIVEFIRIVSSAVVTQQVKAAVVSQSSSCVVAQFWFRGLAPKHTRQRIMDTYSRLPCVTLTLSSQPQPRGSQPFPTVFRVVAVQNGCVFAGCTDLLTVGIQHFGVVHHDSESVFLLGQCVSSPSLQWVETPLVVSLPVQQYNEATIPTLKHREIQAIQQKQQKDNNQASSYRVRDL